MAKSLTYCCDCMEVMRKMPDKCRNRECGATVSFNNYYYNAHVDEAVKAWNTRTGASR